MLKECQGAEIDGAAAGQNEVEVEFGRTQFCIGDVERQRERTPIGGAVKVLQWSGIAEGTRKVHTAVGEIIPHFKIPRAFYVFVPDFSGEGITWGGDARLADSQDCEGSRFALGVVQSQGGERGRVVRLKDFAHGEAALLFEVWPGDLAKSLLGVDCGGAQGQAN